MNPSTYLGDGLYCEWDGFQYRLFTPQGNETFLEPQALLTFFRFIEQTRSVRIKVIAEPQIESEQQDEQNP